MFSRNQTDNRYDYIIIYGDSSLIGFEKFFTKAEMYSSMIALWHSADNI